MKKIITFVLIISIFLTAGAFADNAVTKLGRGIANIGTCVLEIPKAIGDSNTEDGPIAAATVGVLTGILKTGVRLVVGVYEVVTFPIPAPKHYGPVLTEPEFFLEEGLY